MVVHTEIQPAHLDFVFLSKTERNVIKNKARADAASISHPQLCILRDELGLNHKEAIEWCVKAHRDFRNLAARI